MRVMNEFSMKAFGVFSDANVSAAIACTLYLAFPAYISETCYTHLQMVC
jgi:hypothetical protein